jgi:hypothetical protein
MEASLIESLEGALEHYRQATSTVVDGQAKEDYLRLIAITEKLADSLRAGAVAEVKIYALGFSRQVSDSFSPRGFKK